MESNVMDKTDKQSKSLQTKYKIIDATYKSLLDGKAISARSIAKRAKVALGTLYYYFDDLNAILDEIVHIQFVSIYNIIDNYNSEFNHFHRLIIGEILAMMYSKGDKTASLYFLSRNQSFREQHYSDMKESLKIYDIKLSDQDILIQSMLLRSIYSTFQSLLVKGEITMEVIEATLYSFKKIYLPLGVPEAEIDAVVEPAIEIAKKTQRIDILTDWIRYKYEDNENYTTYLYDYN